MALKFTKSIDLTQDISERIMAPKSIDLTQDIIESLIVTALEGGSNYWYLLDTDEFEKNLPEKAGKFVTLTERIAKALYEDPEFKMNVYDKENPEDLLGTVTQDSVLKAFMMADKNHSEVVTRFMNDEADADDADIIFQFATMGELVFG